MSVGCVWHIKQRRVVWGKGLRALVGWFLVGSCMRVRFFSDRTRQMKGTPHPRSSPPSPFILSRPAAGTPSDTMRKQQQHQTAGRCSTPWLHDAGVGDRLHYS